MRLLAMFTVLFSLSVESIAADSTAAVNQSLPENAKAVVIPAEIVGTWQRTSLTCQIAKISVPNDNRTITINSNGSASGSSGAPFAIMAWAADTTHGAMYFDESYYGYEVNADRSELVLVSHVMVDDNACPFNDLRKSTYVKVQ